MDLSKICIRTGFAKLDPFIPTENGAEQCCGDKWKSSKHGM